MSTLNSFLEAVPFTIFVLLFIDFFVFTLDPVKLTSQFENLEELFKPYLQSDK